MQTHPSVTAPIKATHRLSLLLVKVPCYSDCITPPLGLGYLAASVMDIADVQVVDAVRDCINPKRFAEIVHKRNPDVIGFSVVTTAAKRAMEFMTAARQACPSSILLAGGPHPTVLPEHMLRKAADCLDYIICGEAEVSLRKLLMIFNDSRADTLLDRHKIAGEVPGLATIFRDDFIRSAPDISSNIDQHGIPAWHLMPPSSYPHAPHGSFARKFPVAPIITSRGCAYSCGFCSIPKLSGRAMRYRSPELIAEEIATLRDKFEVRELQIIDDNFTLSKQHALAVCDAIITKNLIMPWSCPNGVRVDSLDDEILRAMKASGCYSVSFGIESGSPMVLKRMNKQLSLDIVISRVEAAVSLGLEANAFFILGYPGESQSDAIQTLRLAKSLPLTRANFALFTPMPGTPIFDSIDTASRDDIIGGGSYFGHTRYVSPMYTAQTLKGMQRKCIFSFYARRVQAWRLLKSIRSPSMIFFIIRRAIFWLWGIRA